VRAGQTVMSMTFESEDVVGDVQMFGRNRRRLTEESAVRLCLSPGTNLVGATYVFTCSSASFVSSGNAAFNVGVALRAN